MSFGFFVPHDSSLCPGTFGTPSIQTRMHYTLSQRTDSPYINGGCLSIIQIGNDALSSFQNAQLSIPFTLSVAGRILITLSVGGTYSFSPVVQVDGSPYLTTAGSVSVSKPAGGHTLNFSINPVAPGSVPSDGITVSAQVTF